MRLKYDMSYNMVGFNTCEVDLHDLEFHGKAWVGKSPGTKPLVKLMPYRSVSPVYDRKVS